MCLRRQCLEEFGEQSAQLLRVCAPTGTAAFNIMGETLHRCLSLPVPLTNDLPELTGEQLQSLQTRLEGLRLLIIDEMSMVGRKLLRAVDLRLRQAFPRHSAKPFGAVSVCLMGDFGQLPPVMDRPMYDSTSGGGRLSEDGRASFRAFKKAVVLRRVERVRGSEPAQEQFRRLLSHVRDGNITIDDYRLLSTRLEAHLSDEERRKFADAPRLVASHEVEQDINRRQLRNIGRPCFNLKAVHQPATARKKSAQDAGGLEPVVQLTEGAKVMLKSNMWVSAGLTNGTLGTVAGLLYPPDAPDPDTLPAAVCVEFPGYQGPAWNPEKPKVVPVPAITSKWMEGARLHSRTQIPLALAFAVTIHKCQGWTRPAVWVDIGPKEFALGLTFVALSRATSLRGLILNPTDPAAAQWSRLVRINNSNGQKKRKEVDRLLQRLQEST
ncbi:ATP-dependent DNA helicase PIF1-like [Amphibalanus amphitrite]|uniref:ATP-dependent DNA helicase PIF1-like n=1 Tax=Amphibalanus amphitrite TaxID=1232801 RepID=UPI001C905D36|nr:ATP-dependent DNA helicase PIF1-like [Amphibalanus amphitrite]